MQTLIVIFLLYVTRGKLNNFYVHLATTSNFQYLPFLSSVIKPDCEKILCCFRRQSNLVFLIKELYWHCIRIKFTLESRCHYIKTTKCYRGGSLKRYLLAEISDTIKNSTFFSVLEFMVQILVQSRGKKWNCSEVYTIFIICI